MQNQALNPSHSTAEQIIASAMQMIAKPYELTVSFHHDDEWDYDTRQFDTLQECVDYVNTFHHSGYHNQCDIEINGRKIHRANGVLVGKDGTPFCTNQAWHDLFADMDYPRIIRRAL